MQHVNSYNHEKRIEGAGCQPPCKKTGGLTQAMSLS